MRGRGVLRDVVVVGGGPAGLYAALLLKCSHPAARVRVLERNRADQTFGFGVVFSGRTLDVLAAADAPSAERIAAQFVRWDDVVVAHQEARIAIGGNRFYGIARLELLRILQARCAEVGVEVTYGHEVEALDDFAGADLLVGADGVGSLVRRAAEGVFEPTVEHRPNAYIWYGTPRAFEGLTLTFREHAGGVFAAHSYRFDRTMSTFIVECDPATFEAAGLGEMSEAEGRACLERVFATDLAGEPLVSNDSRWIHFRLVTNRRWVDGRTALLGDAAHTAHFSIGSGTKLALEDAIALAAGLRSAPDVPAGLRAFEAARKPVVDDYQAIAARSMAWFEDLRAVIELDPMALAYSAMMRSGRLTHAGLGRRCPDFVASYDRWKEGREG